MKPSTLTLLGALLLGLLARDIIVGRARAEEDAIRRSDIERIVRALEAQAKVTADVGREIRDAARACK